MNRTRGPLQQHLHLNAGASPTYTEIRTTITEYQRAHTTFSRLQQSTSSAVSTNYNGGAAPMDIGAISKGKYKGKGKGKHKARKAKRATRKRLRKLRSTSTGKLHLTVNKRERKKLDKECPSKDNTTKEEERPTASQQDKEKDKLFATSVDNQATQ